jgi:hypothetical protein
MQQIGLAGHWGMRRDLRDLRLCPGLFRHRVGELMIFPYEAHETDTFPGQGLDQPLMLATIADRGAGQVDTSVQGRL